MKVFLFSCLFLALICYVASEVFSLNGSHPEYPGACHYDEQIYEPGEHIVRRKCTKIICDEHGWISGHDCLRLDYKTNCVVGEKVGFGRSYPECCLHQYHCVHENGTAYIEIDL